MRTIKQPLRSLPKLHSVIVKSVFITSILTSSVAWASGSPAESEHAHEAHTHDHEVNAHNTNHDALEHIHEHEDDHAEVSEEGHDHEEEGHSDHPHDESNHGASEHQHEEEHAHNETKNVQEDDHDHGEHNEDGHDHGSKVGHVDGAHDEGGHDEEGHDEHDHGEAGHGDEHGHSESIELTSTQLTLAGIQVETLTAKKEQFKLYAPGELISNAYLTYIVTPRIDSQVIERFAVLGDHVQRQQPLVKLFSKEMAQAQADFLSAANLWNRYRSMSQDAVSKTERNQAKIAFDQARDSLHVLGMSSKDIQRLEKSSEAKRRNVLGEYTLYASKSGIILGDKFRQGEVIEAGTLMFEIANESELWVEAQLNPQLGIELKKGTDAQVIINNEAYAAVVFQSGHTIDETSRTRLIRLSLKNPKHTLHAGQFADVYFQQSLEEAVTVLPDSALMQSPDGDWIAFVEEKPNHFISKEVELGQRLGEQTIIRGIENGSRVVTKGAFFIASEQAKAGFDIHNH